MTQEETRILAMVECLLIWSKMAETGWDDKCSAIEFLFNKKLLSKGDYKFDCPFCEYLRTEYYGESDDACLLCLWPVSGPIRCLRQYGLYGIWSQCETVNGRKKAASNILNMLKNIPME